MEFGRHFTKRDLEKLFEGFSLPEDFMFGCANAPYQVEGGLNGHGEPLNNWAEFERSGRTEASGEAIRWWTDYPEQIERASRMGINAFRMGIEWARVQPEITTVTHKIPEFDAAAVEAYSDMVAAVMKAGMEPVITLHHFTHPYWLGLDFWLENERLDLYRTYVEEVSTRINTSLIEKHSLRPVRYWITINEPNGWSFITYALRMFPHHKPGIRRAFQAWSNMIDAHCRAYDAIHKVYSENSWETPRVSYNTIHFSAYGVDKVMTDLLNARRNGVERKDLAEYLEQGKKAWDAEVAKCPVVRKAAPGGVAAERFLDRMVSHFTKLSHFENGIDAIYRSDSADKLDYLAVDFYDPFLRNMIKAPSLQDLREKRFNFNAEHWEWVLNPVAMYHFLKAETINADGLPVFIVENGMCNKVYHGRVEQRQDGATRDRFLQAFIFEALRAKKDGVPLIGYLYWSMVDNYEWGSYDPRFGLFTVDRSRSPVKISSVDSWGTNAAHAYGEIISALRSGDQAAINRAFTNDD
ncbi:MAG TPA: family 1 glycosylhydrolase [Candidatus Anoxymicrobiaceae bacterium]